MARDKPSKIKQGKLITVFLVTNLSPEPSIALFTGLLTKSWIFPSLIFIRDKANETGAVPPFYNPKALRTIIFFACSSGITSIRKISRYYKENMKMLVEQGIDSYVDGRKIVE